MNKAFTLSYNDVIRKSGQNEETLLQCAYSEVLSCQKRAEVCISLNILKVCCEYLLFHLGEALLSFSYQ